MKRTVPNRTYYPYGTYDTISSQSHLQYTPNEGFGAVLLFDTVVSQMHACLLCRCLALSPVVSVARAAAWGGGCPCGERPGGIEGSKASMPRSSGQDVGPGDGGGAGVSSQQQQQVRARMSRVRQTKGRVYSYIRRRGAIALFANFTAEQYVHTYVPRIVRVCCVSCPWHPGRLMKGLLNQFGKSYPVGRSETGRAGKCSVLSATCAPARGRFACHKNRSAPFSSGHL